MNIEFKKNCLYESKTMLSHVILATHKIHHKGESLQSLSQNVSIKGQLQGSLGHPGEYERI